MGAWGLHFCDTMFEVSNKTVILVWQRGEGSGNLQICLTSFMNDPIADETRCPYEASNFANGCDYINLEPNFTKFRKCLRFLLKIWYKFWTGFLIVVTKLIKSCSDCIKKINIYWNRSILYQNRSKKSNILTFSIQINIFDLLINNLIF